MIYPFFMTLSKKPPHCHAFAFGGNSLFYYEMPQKSILQPASPEPGHSSDRFFHQKKSAEISRQVHRQRIPSNRCRVPLRIQTSSGRGSASGNMSFIHCANAHWTERFISGDNVFTLTLLSKNCFLRYTRNHSPSNHSPCLRASINRI